MTTHDIRISVATKLELETAAESEGLSLCQYIRNNYEQLIKDNLIEDHDVRWSLIEQKRLEEDIKRASTPEQYKEIIHKKEQNVKIARIKGVIDRLDI